MRFPILKSFCLSCLLSIYFVPGIVTMTDKKIRTIIVSSSTLTYQPFTSSPVTWALFLVVIVFIGDGDLWLGGACVECQLAEAFLGGFTLF